MKRKAKVKRISENDEICFDLWKLCDEQDNVLDFFIGNQELVKQQVRKEYKPSDLKAAKLSKVDDEDTVISLLNIF